MSSNNPQDIPCRRVYIVRAKPELLAHVRALEELDLYITLATPTVVMTDELPFEQYLEGWCKAIYEHCQRNFLHDLLEENNPFPSQEVQTQLLGQETEVLKLFVQHWTMEEADYLQVPTTWKHRT